MHRLILWRECLPLSLVRVVDSRLYLRNRVDRRSFHPFPTLDCSHPKVIRVRGKWRLTLFAVNFPILLELRLEPAIRTLPHPTAKTAQMLTLIAMVVNLPPEKV